MNVNEILLTFCQYGFRKASMEDLAKAAGLSRQSLYKKYGSKEALFDGIMREMMISAHDGALKALQNDEKDAAEKLADAFDRWEGDSVDLLRSTPHGAELLQLAIDLYEREGCEKEGSFFSMLEDVLLEARMASNPAKAADMAFTLTMAGKGLLIKASSRNEFRSGMERVISAISK